MRCNLAIVVMAFVVGCGVMPHRLRARVGGTVRDAVTGRPLAGAVISARTYVVPCLGRELTEKALDVKATTDADGRWSLPEVKRWEMLMLIGDTGYDYATIYDVAAPGFEKRHFSGEVRWPDGGVHGVEDVLPPPEIDMVPSGSH